MTIDKEKRALILCASHNDLGLIRALRKLGYYIICIGYIPGLIGERFVDEYIQMDYSDKESVLQLAKEKKIDAICQCCNDFAVYTAAYVAEKMGLPGYDSYETTLMLHNKDKFKVVAESLDITSPKARSFSSEEEAINWLHQVEYPVIVKPTDASAGNGIQKVTEIEEAKKAVTLAFEKSRAKRIVIEKFIEGTQHGFCSFLVNQKVVAYSSNNEYSIVNPYRVEIDTFPADNCQKVKDVLIEQIEKIARELKLKDGIFHLQYIMDEDKPQIIEVMRRVLGNMYSVPANQINGFDWDYWEVRAKCGLSCKEFPKPRLQDGFYAYKTIVAEKNGVIKRVHISSKYDKYCYDYCIVKKEGDCINNYLKEPVGFLFLQFSSQEEMQRVLIDEYENNMVEME